MQTQKDKRLGKKRGFIEILLFLAFCLLNLSAASGQANIVINQDSTNTPISIGEIQVQAFRFAEKLQKTPGAISVIPALRLNEVPAQQIDFVVNQIPGVYMQSGSLNTNRLTIRGIGGRSPYDSNKVRAYYEDIPLTNGSGETTLEDLDQSLTENLEIIKGPASGYYGSGLGGTLLFRASLISTSGIEAEGSYSSYNRQNYRIKAQLCQGSWRHALAAELLNSDGYRENNETRRINLSYLGHLKTANHQLDLIFRQTDLKAYIPSSVDLESFQNKPRAAAPSWAAIRGNEDYQKQMAGLSVQSEWGNGFGSRISLFGQLRNSDELRPFNFLREDSRYGGFRSIGEKNWFTAHGKINLSLGNESFWEYYNWTTAETADHAKLLSDNREIRKYSNFFSQISYSGQKFRVTGSINLNLTNYRYRDQFPADSDQSSSHHFKPIFSPRLAANYAVTSAISVYASLSHGFSPPSLEETLRPDGQRNTEIKPETAWSGEIGSRGRLFPNCYFDLSAYYMQVSNLLVARRTAEDAWIGINAGKSIHPGIELSLDWQWLQAGKLKSALRLAGDYAPHHFGTFVDGEYDFSDNDLTGSPKTRFNLLADTNIGPELQVLLHLQQTGRIPLRDDNSVYTDSYHLLNLTVNYRKRWDKLEFLCSASALNLTDTHYASMVLINASAFGNQQPRYYYPGLPRNFACRIQLGYTF